MKFSHSLTVLLSRMAAREAEAINVPMVIAFADSRGELVHYACMDDALPAARTIAINKAYTSAVLRMPTHEVGQLAEPEKALYGIQHTLEGKVILFGGGFPLWNEQTVVGAIGVSGGTVEEDMQVVESMVEAWEQMIGVAGTLKPIVQARNDDQFLQRLTTEMKRVAKSLPMKQQQILEGAMLLLNME